jgi:hypothetical protein
MIRVIQGAAALLGLALAVGAAAEPAPVLTVERTAFIVRLPDGRALAEEELVGAVLEATDETGRPLTVRVDGFAHDPRDPAGEILLYRLSALGESGAWDELCLPDPDGERWAFPLAGTWTATGEHVPGEGAFSVTCTSGAAGKCVRAGYKPWARALDGTSLRDHHQACVRMFRADYCGDGVPTIRDGTLIDFYDDAAVQAEEGGRGFRFEAGWAKDGAVCVTRPRIPENVGLEALERRCPARLAGLVGPACTEERARAAGALILNKS